MGRWIGRGGQSRRCIEEFLLGGFLYVIIKEHFSNIKNIFVLFNNLTYEIRCVMIFNYFSYLFVVIED